MIASLPLVLAYCAAKKPAVTEPADKELLVAQKKWSTATAEDLKTGYKIYTGECTACNGTKKITKFTEAEWTPIIDRMALKAKLSGTQKEKLTWFVQSYREANAVAAK